MGVHPRDEDDGIDRETQNDPPTNVEPKTKKPAIDLTTVNTYNELLMSHVSQPSRPSQNYDHQTNQETIKILHYAPIPTSMETTTDITKIPEKFINKKKPDYEKIQKRMKKVQEREEKIRLKKMKRANERRISSKELLHYLPVSYTHEKRFNRCIRAQPPHCSICQLFVSHPKDDDKIWADEFELPKADDDRITSQVLLPRSLLMLNYSEEEMETSELIQCTICMLSVHKLCYGIEKMPENKKDWICDRCVEPNRSSISCALCPCRGGALKAISDCWVHSICALSIPNFNFIDLITPNKNRSIRLPDVTEKNTNTTCHYCAKNMNMTRYVQGRCVNCVGHWGKDSEEVVCQKKFHPTCGHRNGAKFDCFDLHLDPEQVQPIQATCYDCLSHDDPKKEVRDESQLTQISPGTQVVAPAQGGSYQRGVVEALTKTNYFDVYFPERSEVELEVHEEKIKGLNPNGEYRVGDRVVVKGSKRDEREGKMKAHHEKEEYHVRFPETQQSEKITRENIYTRVDEMPINLAYQLAAEKEESK